MTKLIFSCPSETPGAVLDIKKGRASISLTADDLNLVTSLHTLVSINGLTGSNGDTADAETQTPGSVSSEAAQ